MANPVVKWQRWDSVSYNWLDATATGPAASIEAEWDAWISTVNAHASNAGKQVTKKKGYADGSGNYMGIVLEVGANSNADKAYLMRYSNSTSNLVGTVGISWTDDAGNGGYGTMATTQPYSNDTSISWLATTGSNADFLIAYDTTEGEEFFFVSQRLNGSSTGYQDGYGMFKDTSGNWVILGSDGSYYGQHLFYGPSSAWAFIGNSASGNFASPGSNVYQYCRLAMFSTISSGGSEIGTNYIAVAANPNLLTNTNNSAYSQTGVRRVMTDLGDGNNVYILTLWYYGACLLMDLRP